MTTEELMNHAYVEYAIEDIDLPVLTRNGNGDIADTKSNREKMVERIAEMDDNLWKELKRKEKKMTKETQLQTTIEYAANAAYETDEKMIVGKIGGRWEIADQEDLGRIAQMDDPTFIVDASGVDQAHIEAGEIDEDWNLPE